MDLRELDRRALNTLDKLVAAVRPRDLGRRTPCEDWDLGGLLCHQVSENRGFGIALREGSAPDWDSGELGQDPYRTYAESVEGVLTALDDGVLTRSVTIREFGTFPGQVAVGMHLVDSVAHGWDIARSLDLPYDPDPEAVRAAMGIAGRIPTDPELRREHGTFAPVVELSADAPELDRFLALLGRSPDWR